MPQLAPENKPLLGKIRLTGTLVCRTGLHIGNAGGNFEIGGIDKAVIRDPLTRRPYIPGSSLKGKLRSLLERSEGLRPNHHGGSGVFRHECRDWACPVCRLFGSAASTGEDRKPMPGRLLVRDAMLTEASEKQLREIDTGLEYTEWKFENALDRITSAANPRQLERVPAGAEFAIELVYNVETANAADATADLQRLVQMLALLEDDALEECCTIGLW